MSHIVVRFDVPEHYVVVDTFIASAHAAQKVLETLNREIFADKLELTLVVAAPEPGSIRQVLRVVVKGIKGVAIGIGGTWAIVWTVVEALETDIAKDVVRELTGKYPAQIAVDTIRAHKERLEAASSEEEQIRLEREICRDVLSEVADLMADASSGAIAAPRSVIENLNLDANSKFELGEAQAEVFEACLSDSLVRAIDFENSD